MTDSQPIVPEEAPRPPTPEEFLPLILSDFLPAAKRNLDATSAKHLAEVAKIAHDMNKFTLRDECLLRVNAIVAGFTVAP